MKKLITYIALLFFIFSFIYYKQTDNNYKIKSNHYQQILKNKIDSINLIIKKINNNERN